MSNLDYASQVAPAADAGPIDKRYLKGIPGIIKMVEAVSNWGFYGLLYIIKQ